MDLAKTYLDSLEIRQGATTIFTDAEGNEFDSKKEALIIYMESQGYKLFKSSIVVDEIVSQLGVDSEGSAWSRYFEMNDTTYRVSNHAATNFRSMETEVNLIVDEDKAYDRYGISVYLNSRNSLTFIEKEGLNKIANEYINKL